MADADQTQVNAGATPPAAPLKSGDPKPGDQKPGNGNQKPAVPPAVKPATPPAAPLKSEPVAERRKRLVVDELTDRIISVGPTSVTFRPGQVLDNEHLRQVAEDYGILTRER